MPRIAPNGTAILVHPALARSERTGLVRKGFTMAGQGVLVAGLAAAGAAAAQAILLVLVVGAPIVAGALIWRASRAA